MKKLLLIASFCIVITLHADQICTDIYNRHGIDKDLKSVKGWKRVCNNEKIQNYTDKVLSKSTADEICSCLMLESENAVRDIYTVRNVNKINLSEGGDK